MSELWSSLIPASGDEWWIVATAATANVACALVGCFLVLRRMSLVGDALAHAVLPGLVLSFLLAGSLAIGPMLAGAFAVGLAATFMIQSLQRGGANDDASIGIVFTSLFALGVVLIRRYGHGVDLDPDCVLQGQLVLSPINRVSLGGLLIPRAMLSVAPMLAINACFLTLLWKELKITAFDPALARSIGVHTGLVHYLLMALVAATAVSCFEAVGSILVTSMFIAPAATARLWCDRLGAMLGLSVLIAVATAVLGFWGGVLLNAEPSGVMAAMGGGLFLVAALVAPRHGIFAAMLGRFAVVRRIVREDLLSMLFRLEEISAKRRLGPGQAAQAVGGGPLARWGLWRLIRKGLARRTAEGLQLTDLGRQRAAQIVRSHRLWEAYLVQFLGLPLDHVHEPAARMEHFIDRPLEQKITADLSDARLDPHGREIPADDEFNAA